MDLMDLVGAPRFAPERTDQVEQASIVLVVTKWSHQGLASLPIP
jgi:hypothetical protein